MADNLEVSGADQLAAVAKRCKAVGDNELRKAMLRGLRAAAKPTIAEVKASAVRKLPRKGGLGRLIARSKIGLRTKTSAKSAGVRLEAKLAGHDLGAIDRGKLRHPTYNHRPWVNQTVQAGFWAEPVADNADRARDEMQKVLDDVAYQIGGGS